MSDCKELAKQAIESGVDPLTLHYEKASMFSSSQSIVRTSIWVNSLDLGVISPNEYRFVARRSKQGDALVKRHIQKLFKILPEFLALNPDVLFVTVPVFGRLLDQRVLFDMLFEAFLDHPQVKPDRVCVEVSADILFEELDATVAELKKLKDYGVRIAVSEIGDDFCPVLRLPKLPFEYGFLDKYAVESLGTDKEEEIAGSLIGYLHSLGKKVIASGLTNETQKEAAKRLECEGYSYESKGERFPYTRKQTDGEVDEV